MLVSEGRDSAVEIERINENTIKFYISYVDIEKRGFARDEIWHDRERSEQLFWKMMEEVNGKEDFVVEGPLWIQVHALEKGLEVVVTKSQLPKNSDNIQLPIDASDDLELPLNGDIESLLESKFGKENRSAQDTEVEDGRVFSMLVKFNQFEDVIQLSHSFELNELININEVLYHYKDHYYLLLEFADDSLEEEDQDNIVSRISEYANESSLSIHLLEEYGKIIFTDDVLNQVREYFKR